MATSFNILIFILILSTCNGLFKFDSKKISEIIDDLEQPDQPPISEYCNKTVFEDNINEINLCISNLCDLYHCTDEEEQNKNDNEYFCKMTWGSICCGMKVIYRFCSRDDRKRVEDFIAYNVNLTEQMACSKWLYKSYDCESGPPFSVNCNNAIKESSQAIKKCQSDSCNKYDCNNEIEMIKNESFCKWSWDHMCCFNNEVEFLCSENDQIIAEDYSSDQAKVYELSQCQGFPRKSYSYKKNDIPVSEKCTETIENNRNDSGKCGSALCKKYDCKNEIAMGKNETYCNYNWDVMCCFTDVVENFCSVEDQKKFEEYISEEAKITEEDRCADLPRKSFTCNGANKLFINSLLMIIFSLNIKYIFCY